LGALQDVVHKPDGGTAITTSPREILAQQFCNFEDQWSWDSIGHSSKEPYYHQADHAGRALERAGFFLTKQNPTPPNLEWVEKLRVFMLVEFAEPDPRKGEAVTSDARPHYEALCDFLNWARSLSDEK
jgi:hypothetical protein